MPGVCAHAAPVPSVSAPSHSRPTTTPFICIHILSPSECTVARLRRAAGSAGARPGKQVQGIRFRSSPRAEISAVP